jgi:hypothetical protein
MKRIVYLNGGKLAVCTPVGNNQIPIGTDPVTGETVWGTEQLTEDEAVARAMAKLPATATDITVLPESAIPASREHRELWAFNQDKTAVIVPAAAAAIKDAEQARQAEIDSTIAADSVIASIKAMSSAEYDAYWAANVTNAAQAIGVLKRVVRVLVRRVL